jgi:hypothetical protein
VSGEPSNACDLYLRGVQIEYQSEHWLVVFLSPSTLSTITIPLNRPQPVHSQSFQLHGMWSTSMLNNLCIWYNVVK